MPLQECNQVYNGLHKAGASFAAKLNYIAMLDTSNVEQVLIAATVSSPLIGIIKDKAPLGQPTQLQVGGYAWVISDGTPTVGNWGTAKTDGSGKAALANPSGGTNNRVIGKCIYAQGVDGLPDLFDLNFTQIQG